MVKIQGIFNSMIPDFSFGNVILGFIVYKIENTLFY